MGYVIHKYPHPHPYYHHHPPPQRYTLKQDLLPTAHRKHVWQYIMKNAHFACMYVICVGTIEAEYGGWYSVYVKRYIESTLSGALHLLK